MNKYLFIDRDGTLINEPLGTFQINNLEELEFKPCVIKALYDLIHIGSFKLVMVSNQDGLGSDSYPQESFDLVQNKLLKTLENESIFFDDVLIDKHFEWEASNTRKPGIGMLLPYFKKPVLWEKSFVIGDRITDYKLAENLGIKALLIKNYDDFSGLDQSLVFNSWMEISNYLLFSSRKEKVKRKTKETEIEVEINLDGKGMADIQTGLGFFDHMLEQISRHAQIDLKIRAQGDLHIDEHHLIEDTAITLGLAFDKALGDKRGIERYGFLLPMDEAEAQVSLDFSGRPFLVFNAEFKRDYINGFPTEMTKHFFKSFSDAARLNLNIQVDGENDHHKIESIFKAFARSLKMAVKREFNGQIPSSKGVL